MEEPRISNGLQTHRLDEEQAVASGVVLPARPVLNYAATTVSEPVTIAQCRTTMEATMLAQALQDAGIAAQITDQNTEVLGPYAAGSSVRVIVPSQDATLAKETLEAARRTQSSEVEPVDIFAEAGLETVAAFEQAWQLKEAAITLSASRIEVFVPKLIPRGENGAGVGRRFVLRVEKSDADEARDVLRDSNFDADDRRCARCGCERIVEEMGFWQFFLDLIFIVRKRRQYSCVGCQHRGGEVDFRETDWLREAIVE